MKNFSAKEASEKNDIRGNTESKEIKSFSITLFFLMAFFFLLIYGILVAVTDDIGLGGKLIAFGVIGALISFFFFKKSVASAKQVIDDQNTASGDSGLKKKLSKIIVAFSVALVIVPVLGVCIYGFAEASYIAKRANKLAKEPVDLMIFEEIEKFDEYYEEQSSFAKFFFVGKGKVKKVKAEAEQLIIARAAEITAGINALEPVTQIESRERYNELHIRIDNLKLDKEDAFDAWVLEYVENYDEYVAYEADFEKLLDNYRVREDCSSCGGIGRSSCPSCNGSGKNLVTWYEHGDWGEKSYSSYTCKKCDGKGVYSCGKCGGSGSSTRLKFDDERN